MTKQDYINHWKDTSESDWETVQILFNAGKYVHALFFAHLVIEKLAKAIWIKDNEDNVPPKIHNIITLLNQTNFKISEPHFLIFTKLNNFQLHGRYADYKAELYKTTNKDFTRIFLNKTTEVKL